MEVIDEEPQREPGDRAVTTPSRDDQGPQLGQEDLEPWDYAASVAMVKETFVDWRTKGDEYLLYLWNCKQSITKGRVSGRPKDGEISWARFVKDCFGDGPPTKRTIDGYLDRFAKQKSLKGEKGTGTEQNVRPGSSEDEDSGSESEDDTKTRREYNFEIDESDQDYKPEQTATLRSKVLRRKDTDLAQIRNVVRVGDLVTFEIFLPLLDKTYVKSILLEGKHRG